MVKTEAPACAKAAGNSYSLHLPLGAPLLDSTMTTPGSRPVRELGRRKGVRNRSWQRYG